MNSDDESMRDVLSEKGSSHHGSRTREGPGWSVGSSHNERVHGNLPRELRDWSVGAHKDRVIGYHAREGRGWSAGPSQVDSVQGLQMREERGRSVGSAPMARANSERSKEKKNWFSKRAERVKKDEKRLSSAEVPGKERTQSQQRLMYSKRAGRAHSVSAANRYKVDHSAEFPRPRSYSNNLSTVLSKPLPLPPFSVPPPMPLLRRSNPQLANRHLPPPTHSPPPPRESLVPPQATSAMEVSGDYTAPVPVTERYKYDPKLRQETAEISSVQGPFDNRSHDYSDPDEPDDETRVLGKYDHLSPHEADIHPERHSQAFSDLEGLNEESMLPYMRGYVPTEVYNSARIAVCGVHYLLHCGHCGN